MTAPADLDPQIYALMVDPKSHGAPVKVVETHAARVFLTGERAYKLKKPINLGYLDFSSLEQREAALREELRLNHPNAPALYRGVIWITREAYGQLALAGSGPRVEPVLEMACFDQGDLLDQLALNGEIDGGFARDLADIVFESHERAEPGPFEDGATRIRGVLARAVTACIAEENAPVERLKALEAALDARLLQHSDLLDARAEAGFVRHCHGDLHLGNIVRLNGEPVLFDALEFSEDLARIDTLYDLAFLLMDLIHRGLPREASALLSQYTARLKGALAVQGLVLLPAFCGLRALIRALTCYDRGRAGDDAEALAFLDLAEACAAPTNARMLAIGGLSGTGKSTLAEGLARDLHTPPGAVVLRADLERKAMAGVSWRDALPPDSYTQAASDAVYARQREKAHQIVQAGASVVVDAVHGHKTERDAIKACAEAAGAGFDGIWLDAPGEVIRARVEARRADPSDADLLVVDKQAGFDPGEIVWPRLSTQEGAKAVLAEAQSALKIGREP